MNPFEGMTNQEIADYVKRASEEFVIAKESDPEFGSCQDALIQLVLEAKERGPLDLRITIDKDGKSEVWRVRVEQLKETKGEI